LKSFLCDGEVKKWIVLRDSRKNQIVKNIFVNKRWLVLKNYLKILEKFY
jgi:hypothetical protein